MGRQLSEFFVGFLDLQENPKYKLLINTNEKHSKDDYPELYQHLLKHRENCPERFEDSFENYQQELYKYYVDSDGFALPSFKIKKPSISFKEYQPTTKGELNIKIHLRDFSWKMGSFTRTRCIKGESLHLFSADDPENYLSLKSYSPEIPKNSTSISILEFSGILKDSSEEYNFEIKHYPLEEGSYFTGEKSGTNINHHLICVFPGNGIVGSDGTSQNYMSEVARDDSTVTGGGGTCVVDLTIHNISAPKLLEFIPSAPYYRQEYCQYNRVIATFNNELIYDQVHTVSEYYQGVQVNF